MFLEDITKINIGIVLRRKEAMYKSKDTYDYKIFNLKNYEEKIEYEDFYSEENLDNYIAKKGDLLFRLAFPIKIIEVDDEIEGLLINSQYCIIRMCDYDNLTYNIDFVKWFLESNMAKNQLEKYLIGTSVKTVPVANLRKLKIPAISVEKQEKLSSLINNWNRQKILYTKIIKEKDYYYNTLITKIIKGEEKNERKTITR